MSVSERTGVDSFLTFTATFRSTVTYLLVLLIFVARMSPTASEETDCREMSGYETRSAPETCTVQLTLNDTEADIISSLKDKYRDFPLGCRLRKYSIRYCAFQISLRSAFYGGWKRHCSPLLLWAVLLRRRCCWAPVVPPHAAAAVDSWDRQTDGRRRDRYIDPASHTVQAAVVKEDRRIRWHYTTTILRLRIGARLTAHFYLWQAVSITVELPTNVYCGLNYSAMYRKREFIVMVLTLWFVHTGLQSHAITAPLSCELGLCVRVSQLTFSQLLWSYCNL